MWVPTTEIGMALDRDVHHDGGPADPVPPQRRQGQDAVVLHRQPGADHHGDTPITPLGGLHPGERGHPCGQAAFTAEVERMVTDVVQAERRLPPIGGVRIGARPEPLGQGAGNDLAAQRVSHGLRLVFARARARRRCPGFFEHHHIGGQRTAHGQVVERPTPAVDAGVHVEIGNRQRCHCSGRR